MKVLLTGLLLCLSVQAFAKNNSSLICENDYGKEIKISYNFNSENVGTFSQDIYDDCFYQEDLLMNESYLAPFMTNLRASVNGDKKFMLVCLSHSVAASTYIYAYENESGTIESKKGYVLDDDSVTVTGSPKCYGEY